MAQRKRRRQRRSPWFIPAVVLGAIVTVLIIVAVALTVGGPGQDLPQNTSGIRVDYTDVDPMDLGQGLCIDHVGNYTGIYMEDGSNDVVSGILMTIVKNTGEKDLQLARFSLKYGDVTAEFEVTNLPAGESVVVLEKNRRSVSGKPESANLSTALFFEEKMTLLEEKVELSGQKGSIGVKNISGEDISGTVWVYYKYSATDLFYGGITFRAKLTGGLKAGGSANIPAGHYDPNSVKLLWVTVEG